MSHTHGKLKNTLVKGPNSVIQFRQVKSCSNRHMSCYLHLAHCSPNTPLASMISRKVQLEETGGDVIANFFQVCRLQWKLPMARKGSRWGMAFNAPKNQVLKLCLLGWASYFNLKPFLLSCCLEAYAACTCTLVLSKLPSELFGGTHATGWEPV